MHPRRRIVRLGDIRPEQLPAEPHRLLPVRLELPHKLEQARLVREIEDEGLVPRPRRVVEQLVIVLVAVELHRAGAGEGGGVQRGIVRAVAGRGVGLEDAGGRDELEESGVSTRLRG